MGLAKVVKDTNGIEHFLFFDTQRQLWFHERMMNIGHIKSAVHEAIELKTRIVQLAKAGRSREEIAALLEGTVGEFNETFFNFRPEYWRSNQAAGRAETKRYGQVFFVNPLQTNRLVTGVDELSRGLADGARMRDGDLYIDTYPTSSPYDDPRLANVLDISPGADLKKQLNEDVHFKQKFAEDLKEFEKTLLDEGITPEDVAIIVAASGPVD